MRCSSPRDRWPSARCREARRRVHLAIGTGEDHRLARRGLHYPAGTHRRGADRPRPPGQVNAPGPHHVLRISGSVHARKTSSRGASITRVTRTRSMSVTAALFEVQGESGRSSAPEDPVCLEPLVGRAQPLWLQTAPAGAPVAAAPHQPGALEDTQVLADGGQAHREGLRQFGHRGFAARQPLDDCSPRRIGQCGEHIIEATNTTVNHMVEYRRSTQAPPVRSSWRSPKAVGDGR